MGLFELENRVKKLESRWNKLCCYLRACLGISSTTGDPDLVLNQQGEWINNGGGGGGSYYLYSENYDSGTFAPQSATGLNSVAMGGGSATSSGQLAMSWGSNTEASGIASTAFGGNTNANGIASTAFGENTNAVGNNSTAFGFGTSAESYFETSIGSNTTPYTPISTSSFEANDRLFIIGNGDGGGGVNADAFTILKNAKVGIDIDNFETTTSLSKLQVNGVVSTSISTINTDITLDETNIKSIILVNNGANSVDITLPDPTTMHVNMGGRMSARLTIKSTATYNASRLVTILPFGGDLIDGAGSFVFSTDYESIELVTDGTDWYIL